LKKCQIHVNITSGNNDNCLPIASFPKFDDLISIPFPPFVDGFLNVADVVGIVIGVDVTANR
jgi:hypothetical protein